MFQFVYSDSRDRAVEIHMRRYSIDEIPEDEERLRTWLDERFIEKDRFVQMIAHILKLIKEVKGRIDIF